MDLDKVMKKLVEELHFQVPFKDQTDIGDVVLTLLEDDDGRINMEYAKVMGFDRDLTKRDEWWHVHFVFLSRPPLTRTIILQSPHFTGQEIFTMGGRRVFIKAINFQSYYDEMSGFSKPKPFEETSGDDAPPPPQAPKGPAGEDKKPGPGGPKPLFTLIK